MRQALTVSCVFAAFARTAAGSFAPVYGGPTYDPPTVRYVAHFLPYEPGTTAGNGIGIGSSMKLLNNGMNAGVFAYRWDSSGFSELGSLGNYPFSRAYAVNLDGTIVGTSGKYVDGVPMGQHAVRWDAGRTT